MICEGCRRYVVHRGDMYTIASCGHRCCFVCLIHDILYTRMCPKPGCHNVLEISHVAAACLRYLLRAMFHLPLQPELQAARPQPPLPQPPLHQPPLHQPPLPQPPPENDDVNVVPPPPPSPPPTPLLPDGAPDGNGDGNGPASLPPGP